MVTERKQKAGIGRKKVMIACAFAALTLATGLTSGMVIGRAVAPEKVRTVTETTISRVFPSRYEQLPEVDEVEYFNVPLSHNLQQYIYEISSDANVPVSLVMAMIERESHFDQELVSDSGDYGLMQINLVNHAWLTEQYRTVDMLNAYQNVFCGIKIIGAYLEKYGDFHHALMAYNLGEYGANLEWDNGTTSTEYSESVLDLMSQYEKEVTV